WWPTCGSSRRAMADKRSSSKTVRGRGEAAGKAAKATNAKTRRTPARPTAGARARAARAGDGDAAPATTVKIDAAASAQSRREFAKQAQPDLAAVRAQIDGIDREIQALIAERALWAHQVGKAKGKLAAAIDYYRPEREA